MNQPAAASRRVVHKSAAPPRAPGPPQPAQPVRVAAPANQSPQQAEERIQLGKQLLGATQAYSAKQAAAVEAIRNEQKALREQIEREVTQSLRSYDQWIAGLEERLSARLDGMDTKIETLGEQWRQTHGFIEQMVKRCEALMDQARIATDRQTPKTTPTPTSKKPSPTSRARQEAVPPSSPATPPQSQTQPSRKPRTTPPAATSITPTPAPDNEPPVPMIYTKAVELLRKEQAR